MTSKDIANIFESLYSGNSRLLETVTQHSECVARKTREVLSEKFPSADIDFAVEAALLHDIGVVKCNAPSIFCFGDLPYICHGVQGRKILDSLGLPRHALVCERHTGSGLTKEDILEQGLPLPLRDMTPQTIEEKAVCYADKFFSKSGNLSEEKPLEKVLAQMGLHGKDALKRFEILHAMFGG